MSHSVRSSRGSVNRIYRPRRRRYEDAHTPSVRTHPYKTSSPRSRSTRRRRMETFVCVAACTIRTQLMAGRRKVFGVFKRQKNIYTYIYLINLCQKRNVTREKCLHNFEPVNVPAKSNRAQFCVRF